MPGVTGAVLVVGMAAYWFLIGEEVKTDEQSRQTLVCRIPLDGVICDGSDKLKFVGQKMKHDNTSRRKFLSLAGLTACGLALGSPLKRWRPSKGELFVYIGTYTNNGRSEGIYVCKLDSSTGELRQIAVAKGVANPSFLTVEPKGRFLYAVNEVKGLVNQWRRRAFSIDKGNRRAEVDQSTSIR